MDKQAEVAEAGAGGGFARRPRFTLARMNGDVSGALAATLVAIPQAMSLGILAFAALGPEYASAGVVAALLASIVGNFAAAATYAMRCQIVGARASVAAIVAGLVGTLAAHPALQSGGAPNVAQVLAFVFLAVALSGVIQVMFGFAGLGRAIKYAPYPVIAGFMNGVAIIILLSQLRPALGLEGQAPLAATLHQLGELRWGSVLTAVVAGLSVVIARRHLKGIPPLLAGLLAGIATHYLVAQLAPASVGSVVGAFPTAIPAAAQVEPMVMALLRPDAGALILELVLPAALLIAVVGAMDGLLAAVVADSVTRGRHDSNRLLVGQGLANVLGSLFGATPAVTNSHAPVASYLAGGRTPLGTLLHALFVLAAMFGLAPLVAAVPVAALAGLMVYIAFTLMDSWTRGMVLRVRGGEAERAEIATNIGIVVVVAAALIALNVMIAIIVGVIAAVAMLLIKISGSPVRRHLDGSMRASLKVRSPEAREALRPNARRIRILELEGELFFGTADRLQSQMDELPEESRIAILDFRRVNQIDATGARILEVIAQRAARRDVRVVLSHVREDEPRGRYLKALGLDRAVPPQRWFPDLDRALEWAEDQMLARARFDAGREEIPPSSMSLFDGLSTDQMARVAAVLERTELHGGDVVFLEGDEGDQLYLIAQGAVSIKIRLDNDKHARRLATFTTGVMFGEMALLESQRRSADAFAKGDRVVLYALSAASLRGLTEEDPFLGLAIQRNISRELAARLRATSGALRALE